MLCYTPINGYSPTVYTYYHGAKVVLETPGYLLPVDGGPALPWVQLGLTEEEYRSNAEALDRREQPVWPLSRPMSLEEIFAQRRDEGRWPGLAGRKFQMMPRVLKTGVNGEKAIVHFQSGDNPFGAPGNVVKLALAMPEDKRKQTVYGFASKTVANCFGLFDERVHVVPPAAVPAEGTNVMVVDPSSARPFFMLWRRDTADGKMFIYREWPSLEQIPGLGHSR